MYRMLTILTLALLAVVADPLWAQTSAHPSSSPGGTRFTVLMGWIL